MKDAECEKVRREILEYLSSHPDASDDIEGIALFWVTRQRIRVAVAVVQDAVRDLVNEGILAEIKGQGAYGKLRSIRYRLSAKDSDEPKNLNPEFH
jgi:hypothetical protein